jgi:hypothetical protein
VVETNRSLSVAAALGAVIVAILGYVIGVEAQGGSGHSHAVVAPPELLHPALAANVLLEAPAGWKPIADAPQIPGLTLTRATAFGPAGEGGHAGLLTGELAAGQPSPLPAGFLAQLHNLPDTEVVNLTQTEAYRYSNLSLPGFNRLLTLYAIPSPGGSPILLACYATAAYSAYMRTCEGIVATLRPVGQTSSEDLTPDSALARQVSAAIGAIDRQRLVLRREMQAGATLPRVEPLATRLAHGFAAAAAKLSPLEPPLAAGPAQAALLASIGDARDAYSALAGAAAAGNLGGYEAARAQVYGAEASVDAALESFTLLGYRHT